MNTKKMVILAITLMLLTSTENKIQADRGGFGAGLGIGLGTGIIASAALSRRHYDSDGGYIRALEDENADLRAELRACRRDR